MRLFFFIVVFTELRSKDFALVHSVNFSNLLVKIALDLESKQEGLMHLKQLKKISKFKLILYMEIWWGRRWKEFRS